MTTTLTPPASTAAAPIGERCDRCSAAAKVRAVLAGGGDLVFCGHHANKYAAELQKIAVHIIRSED